MASVRRKEHTHTHAHIESVSRTMTFKSIAYNCTTKLQVTCSKSFPFCMKGKRSIYELVQGHYNYVYVVIIF